MAGRGRRGGCEIEPEQGARMIESIRLIAIAILSAMFVSAAISSPAFAQAGSTGGSVGKQNKSVSGGDETAAFSKMPRSLSAGAAPQAATISLGGRWLWSADCQSGHHEGGFELTQGMTGQIKGTFFSDIMGGNISGQVSNGTLSFIRNAMLLTQHWVGQVGEGGRHLNGSLTGNENCTWEARKE